VIVDAERFAEKSEALFQDLIEEKNTSQTAAEHEAGKDKKT